MFLSLILLLLLDALLFGSLIRLALVIPLLLDLYLLIPNFEESLQPFAAFLLFIFNYDSMSELEVIVHCYYGRSIINECANDWLLRTALPLKDAANFIRRIALEEINGKYGWNTEVRILFHFGMFRLDYAIFLPAYN